MGFISLFVVLSFTHLSFAFTLSLPATIDTGASVSVQWVRDIGDPTSFGLMQRGLQGGESILSVTPVPNSGGASSGTASVVFPTAGQVLLAGIQQQSLKAGETPNQLAAGKQVTVIGAVDDTIPQAVVPTSSTTLTASSPPPTTSTSSRSASAHPVSGAIIIVAIPTPLLLLFLAVGWIVRRQRKVMRYRIDRFSDVWKRRRRASALAHFNFMPADTRSHEDGVQVVPVAPGPQHKLQLPTQRNATLEREMASASAPLRLSTPPVQEPPPVYAEAVDSVVERAARLNLNKRVGEM